MPRARIALALLLLGPHMAIAQPAESPAALDPPRFTDPARRQKLAAAFSEIDRLFTDFATRQRVPGAAWGIVIDGDLAHAGVSGYREIASRAPVTRETVFRIASMTKSFTAMAILKLRDAGKLALDDPAERYVPELRALAYPTSDSPRITIRHLLTHSGGFPEDNPWGDRQLAVTDEGMSRLMRGGIPFSNAPAVAYEYSNYGFAILGRIVANVSGVSYGEYVANGILRPLGMTSTTLEPAAVPRQRLAHGYRWEDERWKDEPLLSDGAFGAMGGMLTSVPDLARYMGALISAWPPRDGPEGGPIGRASLREMQQLARSSGTTVSRGASGAVQVNSGGYGFGLRISQTCAFEHIVAHSGGLPGFGSHMRWLPAYGVGIVALGNLTYTGWSRTVDAAFEALARTGGLRPRVVQPSASLLRARDDVSRLIARWDDDLAERLAAANLFPDLSRDKRRAGIAGLRARVGACTPPDRFDVVENALRGEWTMRCERGNLRVAITLAPTMPPRVQSFDVRPASASAEADRPAICAR